MNDNNESSENPNKNSNNLVLPPIDPNKKQPSQPLEKNSEVSLNFGPLPKLEEKKNVPKDDEMLEPEELDDKLENKQYYNGEEEDTENKEKNAENAENDDKNSALDTDRKNGDDNPHQEGYFDSKFTENPVVPYATTEKQNDDNTNSPNEEELLYERHCLNNDKLKLYLVQICLKIEENLNQIYYPKDDGNLKGKELQMVQEEKKLTQQMKRENVDLFRQINEFKKKANEANASLNVFSQVNKVNELEMLFNQKKMELQSLIDENKSLKNIKKRHNQAKKSYLNATENREEFLALNEKINKLKEEIKKKKEHNDEITRRNKQLEKEIFEKDKKCQLISDNINYHKKFFNTLNTSLNTSKNNKNTEPKTYINLVEIQKENDELIKNLQNELFIKTQKLNSGESQYKLYLNEQEKKIKKLEKEIAELNKELSTKTTQLKHNKLTEYNLKSDIKKKELNLLLSRNKLKKTQQIMNSNSTEKKNKLINSHHYSKGSKRRPFDLLKFESVVQYNIENPKPVIDKTIKTDTLKNIEDLKSELENFLNDDRPKDDFDPLKDNYNSENNIYITQKTEEVFINEKNDNDLSMQNAFKEENKIENNTMSIEGTKKSSKTLEEAIDNHGDDESHNKERLNTVDTKLRGEDGEIEESKGTKRQEGEIAESVHVSNNLYDADDFY